MKALSTNDQITKRNVFEQKDVERWASKYQNPAVLHNMGTWNTQWAERNKPISTFLMQGLILPEGFDVVDSWNEFAEANGLDSDSNPMADRFDRTYNVDRNELIYVEFEKVVTISFRAPVGKSAFNVGDIVIACGGVKNDPLIVSKIPKKFQHLIGKVGTVVSKKLRSMQSPVYMVDLGDGVMGQFPGTSLVKYESLEDAKKDEYVSPGKEALEGPIADAIVKYEDEQFFKYSPGGVVKWHTGKGYKTKKFKSAAEYKEWSKRKSA